MINPRKTPPLKILVPRAGQAWAAIIVTFSHDLNGTYSTQRRMRIVLMDGTTRIKIGNVARIAQLLAERNLCSYESAVSALVKMGVGDCIAFYSPLAPSEDVISGRLLMRRRHSLR